MNPSKSDFFNVFKQFGFLSKRSIKMNKEEKTFVDIEKMAEDCEVTPYFLMDISSGEMLSIFSAKNVETALRTFKMSVHHFPEILLRDTVLVKFIGKEIVLEGKDYIEEWKKIKDAESARMAALQGVNK